MPSGKDGLCTCVGIFPTILHPKHVGDDDDVCILRLHITFVLGNPVDEILGGLQAVKTNACWEDLHILVKSFCLFGFLVQPYDEVTDGLLCLSFQLLKS